MTVKEIIKDYLDKNGFDGLKTIDCGCHKDDLFPCCDYSIVHGCIPGHARKCTQEDIDNGIENCKVGDEVIV